VRGREEGREGGREGGGGNGGERESERERARARERPSERASERERERETAETDMERQSKERETPGEREGQRRQTEKEEEEEEEEEEVRSECPRSQVRQFVFGDERSAAGASRTAVAAAFSSNADAGCSTAHRGERGTRLHLQQKQREQGHRRGAAARTCPSPAHAALPAGDAAEDRVRKKENILGTFNTTCPTRPKKKTSVCGNRTLDGARPLRPERAQSKMLDAHAYRVSGVDLSSLFTQSALFLTV
jgi:hypothetical protein